MKTIGRLLLFVGLLLPILVAQGEVDASLRDNAGVGNGRVVTQAGFAGASNTFLGMNAGILTVGDDDNATFIGALAGDANTTGADNTFVGGAAGGANTTGSANTFVGWGAGAESSGSSNTFVGRVAGVFNAGGSENTFMGVASGFVNGEGNDNAFYGFRTGADNTGSENTFIGSGAGLANTSGSDNTFVGMDAGVSNLASVANTFVGWNAGHDSVSGDSNVFLGHSAGESNVTGDQNTYVGRSAGGLNNGGTGNVFLGFRAGLNEAGSNRLYIANSGDTTPLIHGEFDTNRITVNGNLTAIGPDSGLVRLADNTGVNTNKGSRMALIDYSGGPTPNYLFGAFSDIANNFIAFGGGAAVANAATQVDIFTAPAKAMLGGTSRVTVLGNGNVGIGTQAPTHLIQLASPAGAFSDGATWTSVSSRSIKGNFEAVEPREILGKVAGLDIQTWTYNTEASGRHLGPTAEDFHAAFGLGIDDRSISAVDGDGVALMAIKGLVEVGREKDARLAAQERRIEKLEARLLALESAGGVAPAAPVAAAAGGARAETVVAGLAAVALAGLVLAVWIVGLVRHRAA